MVATRGGARIGAGRKSISAHEKKRPVSVSLSREAVEALKNLEVVLEAKNPSTVIEFLLLDAWGKVETMEPASRPNLSQ